MTVPRRILILVLIASLAAFAGGLAFGRYAIPSGKPQGKAVEVADGVTVYVSGASLRDMRKRESQSLALARVRAAIPALEAWHADHNSYEDATLAGLRTYDAGVQSIRIVLATRDDYCLESRVGGATASKHGPSGDLMHRPCS